MMPQTIQPNKEKEELPDFNANETELTKIQGRTQVGQPINTAQATINAVGERETNLFWRLYEIHSRYNKQDRIKLMKDSFQSLVIDIETGTNVHAARFMPEFKEPRITASGKPHASDKSIAEQKKEWEEGCALNPSTAEILCIGLMDFNGTPIILGTQPIDAVQADQVNYVLCRNEADMLQVFWKIYKHYVQKQTKFVGANIKDFDFPMLAFRSWVNAVKAEWNKFKDKWMNEVVDLCDIGGMGYKNKISVDNLSKALLGEGKIGSGKDFATLYNNPQTRIAAVRYLLDDLTKEHKCYKRIFFNQ